MSNIIEESMIINRLTSPSKFHSLAPSPNHLSPRQIEVQVSKQSSRQSSKNNLQDLYFQKIMEHPKSDSDNVANPMSSQIDVTQDEVKDRDLDLDVKQVLTEINDQYTNSYQNLDEPTEPQQQQQQQLKINDERNFQNLISKHKQIMIKSNQKLATYRHQSFDQQSSNLKMINFDEQATSNDSKKSNQIQNKCILENLQEIYSFYSKQAVTTNKYNTFDKLSQIAHTMILQKYMFFCKDFQLIDLEITNDLIQQLGGKFDELPKSKRKNQFKFNNKNNAVITKFQLVEVYKKSANQQMELTFEQFEVLLAKLANTIFPEKNALQLLYEYLGLKDPKLYRKKMTIIGKPFNTKEYSEVITQEKLYQRKIMLPPRPKIRVDSVKREREIEEVSLPKIPRTTKCREVGKNEKIISQDAYLKWEDLNDIVQDFDLKKLILEQDLSDKEDDYYLKEYSISVKAKAAQQEVQDRHKYIHQPSNGYHVPQIQTFSSILNSQYSKNNKSKEQIDNSKIVMTQNTKNSNNRSFDIQDNVCGRKKSNCQSPPNLEHNILEKQSQLYRAFLNQQSYRERMVNRKKMIVI